MKPLPPLLALLIFLFGSIPTATPANVPAALPPASPRPGAADGPTVVRVTAWLADISEINSATQSISADLVLLFRWNDPGLAHSEAAPKAFGIDTVWHPPWMIANPGDRLVSTLPEKVMVAPDGEAFYRQRLLASFHQRLNLSRFPFDRTDFKIRILSPGHSPQDISFVPDEKTIREGLANAVGQNPEPTMQDWKILGLRTKADPYNLMPGISLAGYTIEIDAMRLPQHYLAKVILPLLLIVLMSWSVFWIDPTLGASQISVAVTSMLTLIAYRFAIGNEVPRLPYLTLLDAFIMLSTVLVFLSLIEVVVTARLAANGKVEPARMIDRVCRWVFPSTMFAATTALYLFWK
jgi:hypothetical protein